MFPWAAALLIVAGGLLAPLSAQSPAGSIEARIGALEDEIKSLREEIQRLRAGEPPPLRDPGPLPIAGAATRGSKDARLVLVEFSDYECPFCGRYARDTYPLIDQDYVRTGRIQYVFKNFPIEQIHPHAIDAAESAACAGRLGRYWEMHDRLFENQDNLAELDLTLYAKSLGLDMGKFTACMGGETEAAIRQDLEDGRAAGADATPTFFLGTRQADGTLKAFRMLRGAMPYDSFKSALDEALKNPPQ